MFGEQTLYIQPTFEPEEVFLAFGARERPSRGNPTRNGGLSFRSDAYGAPGLRISRVMTKYRIRKGRGNVIEEFDPLQVPDESSQTTEAAISVHEPGRPIGKVEFARLKDLAKRRKIERKRR